jgi:hypothetical protein
MKTSRDIDYYLNLDYNMILKNFNGLFYLYIPELSLFGEGEKLKEAYLDIHKKKEKFFLNIIRLDAHNTVVEPKAVIPRNSIFSNCVAYSLKAFVTFVTYTVLLAVIFVGLLPIFDSVVSKVLKEVPAKVRTYLPTISTKIQDKLDNISEERKEEEIKKIRSIVQNLTPFVNEFKVLFRDINVTSTPCEKYPKNTTESLE